jgi:hypothetical protein
MENGWTFESWRPVWDLYGSLVINLVRHAFPDRSETELRALTIESAARAIVQETSFDPLESLVASVARDADSRGRNRIAAAVDRFRTGDTASSADSSEGSVSRLFDEIQQRALALLDEQPRELAPLQTSTQRLIPASASTQNQTVKTGKRPTNRRRGVAVLLALGVFVASTAISARVLSRRPLKSGALLYLDQANSKWRVVDASSYEAAKLRMPTVLAQTFTATDNQQTVLVTITDNIGYSAEPDFPTDGRQLGLANRADAPVYSAPAEQRPPNTEQVNSYWKEESLLVTLRSESMSEAQTKSFLRGLVATDDLLSEGYQTPEGFVMTQKLVPSKEGSDVLSSLAVERTSGIPLQVRITVSRADRSVADLVNLNMDRKPGRPFGNNRTFITFADFSPALAGHFSEGHYFYQVGAAHSSPTTLARNREGQRASWIPEIQDGRGLTEADERDVLDVLENIRVGTADEWRSQTSTLHASALKIPVQRSLQIGSLKLTLRQGERFPGKTYLCAKRSCTALYVVEGTTRAGDLLIDSHWWHFEELGADGKIAPWTTSPKAENLVTHTDSMVDRTAWYGIDLGLKTRLARNRPNGEILGRPTVS